VTMRAPWSPARKGPTRPPPPSLPTPRLAALPGRTLPSGLRLAEAAGWNARRRGLAGLRTIGPGEGLHLPRTRSVHTVGMRFALDLIWLDAGGNVVRVDRDVQPRRARTCLRARSVVEVAAGRANAFLAAGAGAGARRD
jgi:uncharacterized protein